ncbi:MAG: hypothetical protein ACR2NO_05550 [Chloroflexota bacterium]
MPAGEEFIKHEYDEGISIQKTIVAAAEKLAERHSRPDGRRVIKSQLTVDRKQLEDLETLGALHKARGKKEDVAKGMDTLMTKVLTKGTAKDREDSDVYEAHAVLLSLKRKQLDSSGGMLKTSTAMGDNKAAAIHRRHHRELTSATRELSESLAEFAVVIAEQPAEK